MAPVEVAWLLKGFGRGVPAVYEASPDGFGLAGGARGLDVRVAAPRAGGVRDRPTTDRRDAIRLVRLLAGAS